MSSAYTLACRIHSKRSVYKNDTIDLEMYYISDGMFGTFTNYYFRKLVDDRKIPLPLTLKPATDETVNCTIFGPTCDATDMVINHWIKLNACEREKWMGEFINFNFPSFFGCFSIQSIQLLENIPLPRLNIGDFIIFRNMGAYSIALASDFNGFSTPKVLYYATHKDLYVLLHFGIWYRGQR